MKYFYCDSCFLISCYQDGNLHHLSKHKDQFYISETQIRDELIKPTDLALMVRQSVTVIEDRDEIKDKANELTKLYRGLSSYDCLCMAFDILDGYCLITDDKALIKKCIKHSIEIKTSDEILKDFEIFDTLKDNDEGWIKNI